jgi:tRNA-Thr(GGU) m(6)t(6)A37 methyltransferase TsaA
VSSDPNSDSGTKRESLTDIEKKSFVLFPIGVVRKRRGRQEIRVFRKYLKGLEGLEGFSRVIVTWWFDRNDFPDKRAVLKVHPMGDRANPLRGVFATRSPVRPNLLGLTICRILEIRNGTIVIESIDAFDGTPVVDIKPCSAEEDSAVGKRLE